MSQKRRSRKELLEMLIDQGKEIERQRRVIEEQEAQLQERRIKVEQAGSLAEACMALNRVCESVDAAAEQFLESIRSGSDWPQEERERVTAEAQAAAKWECDRLIAEAEEESEQILAEARREAARILAARPTPGDRFRHWLDGLSGRQSDRKPAYPKLKQTSLNKRK